MTDIVERLRLAEAWFAVDSGPTVPMNTVYGKQLFEEAADEIERLRSFLMRIRDYSDHRPDKRLEHCCELAVAAFSQKEGE